MKLTEAQQTIVTAPLGPLLVTAGAGSGKTRVLTHRLAHLITTAGIRDHEIVALTFTNKAAGEMKRRVEEMLGGPCNAFLGTFHSFCARLLRKYIPEPYTGNFSIYNTADTQKVIKEILAANTFPELSAKDSWKSVEWHLSKMKNQGMDAQEYLKEIAHLDSCNDIVRAISGYEAKLRTSNALDFDDLLVKVHELFDKRGEVLDKLQREIKYVLVDEFQDTNVIQYKIAARLAAVTKNLMVVGDEDQCIYTWRGASIDNLASFRRDFPGAKVYKLEENFRSSKNIVALANKLVANNLNRLDKVLFSNLDDGVIEVKTCFDEREEARTIAEKIAGEVQRGRAGYNDFAVLMRLNALSRVLEEQFLANNIPHIIWGGFKFYERAEIKSVVNYLRVLVNPRDEAALTDIINFPKRGVGEASIVKLRAADETALYDKLAGIDRYRDILPAKAVAGIKNFWFVLNNLRETYEGFGLEALGGELVSTIGLDALFKASKKEEDLNRLENVYQLEHAVKTFAADNDDATLAMFLQSVSLVADADGANPDDSVIISTVHSAKGLEFKTVFVVGLEEGLFPLSRAKNSAAEMEEERRLLYVAITRAKRRLFLSHCSSRFFQGKSNDFLPSEFFEEMDLKTDSVPFWVKKPYNEQGRDTFSSRAFIEKKSSYEPKSDTAKSLGLAAGVNVRHDKFGNGVVLDIIDSNIVKVKFDIAGVKMLSLAFAKLELV